MIISEKNAVDKAVLQAAGLLTDMDNEEYIRGMCELIASMYPEGDMGTADQAELIREKVEEQVRINNA